MAVIWLAGCGTTGFKRWPGASKVPRIEVAGDSLRPNDLVSVIFTGVFDPPARHDERITENGFINLYLIGQVQAAGKSPAQLQDEIRKRYVPQYYRDSLTVTVAAENRNYFVSGEVKAESHQPYLGETTVLKAIAAAGGFTDFAKKTRVRLTRINGEKWLIDADEARLNPDLDPPVYPGDIIFVPRRHL